MADVPRRFWLEPRNASAVLIAVGGAALVPYLLAGPGFFVDDWFALRNARLDVWWNAAGSGQWRARPGAGFVYALTFGLLNDRPWIYVLLAAVMLVACAVVLERVLRRFLPPVVALVIAAAWLVIPNHTSLEAWPSALNIALALLLFLAAMERLTVARPSTATDLTSAALLGLSVLCYEATAPAGAVAVAWMAWNARDDRRRAVRLLGAHGIVLGLVSAWMLTHWNSGKSGLDVWFDPVQVVNAHVSVSVVGENPAAPILGGIVLVVTVLAVYLRLARGEATSSWPFHAIVGGWIVVLLGALPFVRYFYSPVGLGDRVTVVSGLGGAAVLVGAVGWLGQRQRVLGAALAVLILAGVVGTRASFVRDYSVAADDSRRILADVQQRWPTPPDHRIVFGPYPVMKRNIVAFIDADWPIQWLYGTRDVEAGFTLTSEAFATIPERERVDIVALSHLEATDRVQP